jgi:hypothetical protein
VRVRAGLVSLAVVPALAAPACGEDGPTGRAPAPRAYSTEDLEAFVLRPQEGPPATRLVEAGSGPLATVEQFWSSVCCPAQQEVFADAGFQAGYGALFERPGRSGDPIDTRPGYELISSRVALFSTEEGAAEAMREWIEYHDAPELAALPARGLGDDAHAFVGTPNSPAETLVMYFWRLGRLVLSLRVSAGTGTVTVSEVRALVDRMHRRAS